MPTKLELEARVAELQGIVDTVAGVVLATELPDLGTDWVCLTVVMKLCPGAQYPIMAICDVENTLDRIESVQWETDSAFVVDAQFAIIEDDDPRPTGGMPSIKGSTTDAFDFHAWMDEMKEVNG